MRGLKFRTGAFSGQSPDRVSSESRRRQGTSTLGSFIQGVAPPPLPLSLREQPHTEEKDDQWQDNDHEGPKNDEAAFEKFVREHRAQIRRNRFEEGFLPAGWKIGEEPRRLSAPSNSCATVYHDVLPLDQRGDSATGTPSNVRAKPERVAFSSSPAQVPCGDPLGSRQRPAVVAQLLLDHGRGTWCGDSLGVEVPFPLQLTDISQRGHKRGGALSSVRDGVHGPGKLALETPGLLGNSHASAHRVSVPLRANFARQARAGRNDGAVLELSWRAARP